MAPHGICMSRNLTTTICVCVCVCAVSNRIELSSDSSFTLLIRRLFYRLLKAKTVWRRRAAHIRWTIELLFWLYSGVQVQDKHNPPHMKALELVNARKKHYICLSAANAASSKSRKFALNKRNIFRIVFL